MIFIILSRMELLQVLQKNIPQRKKVVARFQKKGKNDLSKFLLQLIKSIKKWDRDIKILNAFFIELYDVVYSYVICGEIVIDRKIMRLLESLALPITYVGEKKWLESFGKVRKVKV